MSVDSNILLIYNSSIDSGLYSWYHTGYCRHTRIIQFILDIGHQYGIAIIGVHSSIETSAWEGRLRIIILLLGQSFVDIRNRGIRLALYIIGWKVKRGFQRVS